jgi:hypothetical protein
MFLDRVRADRLVERPVRSAGLAFALALTIAGCGDDPKTASGDELPLVDGAEVVQVFDEPHGIVDATVRFQVVTHPDTSTGAKLVDQERELLASEEWRLHCDVDVPEAWVADRDGGDEDFIRFGTVEAMREAAMGARSKRELTDSRSTLRRAMVVQISPPGPPPPG